MVVCEFREMSSAWGLRQEPAWGVSRRRPSKIPQHEEIRGRTQQFVRGCRPRVVLGDGVLLASGGKLIRMPEVHGRYDGR
jgi:hypothetical protein